MNTAVPEAYFKKTLTFRVSKHELRFRVSQDLFSSFDIDKGTRLLLRSLVEADYPPFTRILDLGCGYGPLGLTLRSLYPGSSLCLSDRDALAVAFARQNAQLNNFPDVGVAGGLGYDDLDERGFDLIVANIPGKAGEAVTASLLTDTAAFLAPEGLAAVVVVNPLRDLVAGILQKAPRLETVLERNGPAYAVFHFRARPLKHPVRYVPAFERGVYDRGEVDLDPVGFTCRVRTVWGLPEFDSLSYDTALLLNALARLEGEKVSETVVFNPGQGHAAVFIWKLLEPKHITLVDRDLLALRVTRRNLVDNGCPEDFITLRHQVGLAGETDSPAGLIAGLPREDEGQAPARLFLDDAAQRLARKGRIVLAGSSTGITRLVTHAGTVAGLSVRDRERFRGFSSLVLRRA
jgi:16S rRNA (guanine1207-N2)-methyltransferase